MEKKKYTNSAILTTRDAQEKYARIVAIRDGKGPQCTMAYAPGTQLDRIEEQLSEIRKLFPGVET